MSQIRNVVGAGLENLLNAVQASVSLDPVVGFPANFIRSGQNRSGEIIMKNLTDSTATVGFSMRIRSPEARPTLFPGLCHARSRCDDDTRDCGCAGHFHSADDWAWLLVSTGGSEVAHAALYTRTK